MDSDALLGRVRKLLAMAEADGLPDEARETYNAKAAELIAQYGIDRALIEEARPQRAAAADLVMAMDPPYARDKIDLLASVAVPLGCRLVRRSRRTGAAVLHSAHLVGMEADLERTQLLYTSLLVQQAHALALTRPPASEDPRAFRRSWMAGFSAAVYDRLAEAEQAARQRAERRQRQQDGRSSGCSLEVVLADRRTRVEAHVKILYPRLQASRSRQLTGSGGGAGYRAGEDADLGLGARMGGRAPSRALE
jgi:hypothetical protein